MQRSTKGTHILSITKISSPSTQRPVWDIVFKCSHEAFKQFRPGQYCDLHVPDISVVSHPFTANKVQGYDDRLRLLIRETGPFTVQLGKCLRDGFQRRIDELERQSPPRVAMPCMFVSEFNGISQRIKQLSSHDHAMVIAGGIGITPYLTLLMEVIDHHSSAPSSCLKTLELHWMCRDISLIKFLYEEYFSEMLRCTSSNDDDTIPSVKIIVHYTGTQDAPKCEQSSRPDKAHFDPSSEYLDGTYPMKPSQFSVGTKIAVVAFTLIFSLGLWLVWFFFAQIQSQEEMGPRILSLFFTIVSSIALSIGFVHYGNVDKVECQASLSSLKTAGDYSARSTQDESMSHKRYVSFQQHNTGRPNLKNLLLPLEHALSPGIFVCGPSEIMDGVRNIVDDLKIHQSAVYEELFEK